MQQLKSLTRGAGTSVTVDASGNVDRITKALKLTAKGGQMILVGLMPVDAPTCLLLGNKIVTFVRATNTEIVLPPSHPSRCEAVSREVLHIARYSLYSTMKILQQHQTQT